MGYDVNGQLLIKTMTGQDPNMIQDYHACYGPAYEDFEDYKKCVSAPADLIQPKMPSDGYGFFDDIYHAAPTCGAAFAN